MFNIFKKKSKATEVISCVEGILFPLKEVSDPVFSSGAIGRGVAVKPTSGLIVSPVDGIIKMIFPTNHAIGIETKDGLEFLIHVGVDTVKLKGEGFKRIASEGSTVKAGDSLLEVDFKLLEEQGYPTDTLIILTNDETKADFHEIAPYGKSVGGRDKVIFTCEVIKN
ncbi:MAG: PTS glucose transporter subunit IIA [Clostridiaceae bacterium]